MAFIEVSVNINFIACAILKKPDDFPVKEVREMMSKATNVPINDFVLKGTPVGSGEWSDVTDDMKLNDLVRPSLTMLTSTPESKQAVIKLRELQDEMRVSDDPLAFKVYGCNGWVMTKDGMKQATLPMLEDYKKAGYIKNEDEEFDFMGFTIQDYLKTEDYKRTEAGNFSPENPPPEYTEKDEERKQEILRGAFHGTELDYLADKKENWQKWLAGEFANEGQQSEANAQSDTECPDEEVASSSMANTESAVPARAVALPANFDTLSVSDKKVAVQTQLDWHANETKNLKNMMTALNKELRSEDIRLNVLLPSGRSMPITVKPKMTIKAVKEVLETEGVGELRMIRLVVGNDEPKNSRTVSGLGLSNGDTMTMILSLAGGGKGIKVKQENFMKVAKRMEAQSHMDKSKDTMVGSVKTTNDACTALMNASDTNAKHAMRLLMNENDYKALQQAIDGVNASNNRDARLHECAEALFGRLIQRLKDDMAEYTGAIETCHCTFQMMMNDAFVQGGRWDWKSFVTMMQEVMGEKQRAGAGAITSINME